MVDDGSRDNTAREALHNGARVISLTRNYGKGAAMQAGADAAAGDILVLLDADLEDTASQANLLITPVMNNSTDMTIATFPVIPGKGGGLGFAVKLARAGIYRHTGKIMVAPLSGQRALRKSALLKIGGFAEGFGAEVALTIRMLKAGYGVMEIPTEMSHRVTGRDMQGIIHRGRQFLAVLNTLIHLNTQGR